MTPDDLHAYLAQFRESNWSQMTVIDGSDSLHIARAVSACETAPDGLSAPTAPPLNAAPIVVRSPTVGRLRLSRQAIVAPAPGEHVTAGSWLADVIVADRTEAVLSPADGTVASRPARDGDPVEYNQPLIVIQP